MAERNPAIPVEPERTSAGNEIVSWPNTAEQIPQAVGAYIGEPAEKVVIDPAETDPAETNPAEKTRQALEDSVAAVRRSVQAAQRKTRHTADTILENLRTRAREQPLSFIAAIAGIAFVTGVALRIWRSRYE